MEELSKANSPQRQTWSKHIEFILAGIGYAVGLGNVWRFPYLCYRSGGGAFLIPYLIMLVLVGIPLLYMELAIGQYLRLGPVHSLAKVCPLLKGVGMATVAISFIMCTYYNVIITWALYYLLSSFQSPLPWQSCNNTWNVKENCTDQMTNSTMASTASQQFFNYKVLEKTSGVEESGGLRWELFGLLILAWALIYFSIFKGVKSTGKVINHLVLIELPGGAESSSSRAVGSRQLPLAAMPGPNQTVEDSISHGALRAVGESPSAREAATKRPGGGIGLPMATPPEQKQQGRPCRAWDPAVRHNGCLLMSASSFTLLPTAASHALLF
ncbi:INE protein, partial [Polypterus senegalus]